MTSRDWTVVLLVVLGAVVLLPVLGMSFWGGGMMGPGGMMGRGMMGGWGPGAGFVGGSREQGAGFGAQGSGMGMRKGGVEPPRPFGHRILSPARLPVPPLSRHGQNTAVWHWLLAICHLDIPARTVRRLAI